jgi:hypothetical protein
MAASQFTSGQRMDVYRNIFLLNRSFHFIVQRLGELAETGIFNPKYIKEIIGLIQEAQLEANTYLLDPLHSVELDDHAHFGKVRIAMEKRLKGPLPHTKPRR